jgi:uncharacterized protein with HEPN domain
MRNVLPHGYFRTDAGVVWDTVKNQLPELEALVDTVTAIVNGSGTFGQPPST